MRQDEKENRNKKSREKAAGGFSGERRKRKEWEIELRFSMLKCKVLGHK